MRVVSTYLLVPDEYLATAKTILERAGSSEAD
jgi:hypothetical protein